MSRVFVISDSHFSHKNILTFTDGKKPLRPFDTIDEMDEYMVEKWNSVVSDEDIVYHLGDVIFAQTGFNYLRRLKGRKILLMGNHERHKLDKYLEHFEDVRSYKEFGDMILCHIPIHTSQMERWKACIHGHLHSESVKMEKPIDIIDLRYYCVSVEQIDYTPMLLDDVKKVFKDRGVL